MTQNLKNEAAGLNQKELESATRICLSSLDLAIRARQLFSETNRAVEKFSRRFFNSLEFLTTFSEAVQISIDAEQFLFRFSEKKQEIPVLEDYPPIERLSTLLHRQALETLQLQRGVSFEEITRFLNCFFNIVSKSDDPETLITRLDRETFSKIEANFVSSTSGLKDAVHQLPDLAGDYSGTDALHYDDLLDTIDTSFTDKLAFTLEGPMSISPEELASIHHEIEQFTENQAVSDFSDAIFELLDRENDPDEWKVIEDILVNMIGFHIHVGHFNKIAELLESSQLIARKKSQFQKHIDNILHRLSQRSTIEAIIDSCNRNRSINPRRLFTVLSHLETNALPILASVLYHITEDNLREAAIQATSELLSAAPEKIEPLLTTDDPRILHSAFLVARTLHSDTAIQQLGILFHNPACQFRASILRVLKNFPLPRVLSLMLEAIKDPDKETRLETIRHLSNFRHPKIYCFLKEIVLGSDFQCKSRSEKEVLLIALAKLDPKDSYPILNRMLRNRLTLNRTRLLETRMAALGALAYCKDLRASDRLQILAKSKDQALQEMAQRILLRTGGISVNEENR